MSSNNDKPRMLAAAEEVDKISRSMLVWANTFPEKPVDIIKYEFLTADQGDETGMAPVSYTHLDVYKRQRYTKTS